MQHNQSLANRVAAITGAASGIGLASAQAMHEAGAEVILIDKNTTALAALREQWGERCHTLCLDLLNADDCQALLPTLLALTGRLDIFHANAGLYVGGDLVDASHEAIDRMMQLNVNVVMKNVRDVVEHMQHHSGGDVIVTSSLAAHYPTPWEPVYAASKWAIDCFVQTTRRQVFKHNIRVGSISPGPVDTGLLADWPAEKLAEAKANGTLLDTQEVANVVIFMLTRPRGMTIRDVVMMPTHFDL